jgi:peroxiredoxin
MVGRIAPDFVGEVPGGGWLRPDALRGKPVALLIFRPTSPFARELVGAFGAFRNDRALAPTVFLGIGLDSMDGLKRFAETTGHGLPIIRDPGSIARSYVVGEEPSVILTDSNRFVRFRIDGFSGVRFRPRLEAVAEALRRLPSLPAIERVDLAIDYAAHPRAPVFAGKDLDGRPVDLASLRGRTVVLHFFDQECEPCVRDLDRLAPVVRELRPRGVRVVGVASRDLDGTMRVFMREHGIDWPVVIDPDRAIFGAYRSESAPDLFVIDPEGFIRFRERGESPGRGETLRRQILASLGDPRAAGAPEPGAAPERFVSGVAHVGADACRPCHSAQHDQWQRTAHAAAFARLISQGRGPDPRCYPCHTTGSGLRRGFDDDLATVGMTGVQCEVCHGPGDDHVRAPAALKKATLYGLASTSPPADIARVCVACHDSRNDPDFDLAAALPKVTH